MYEHFKVLHAEFMEEDHLRQVFPSWDSNTVEGFNEFITKFLPKDQTFCKMIENSVQIHLAMCLLSIGYEETYGWVFALTRLVPGKLHLPRSAG
jgi:hypothetical protein